MLQDLNDYLPAMGLPTVGSDRAPVDPELLRAQVDGLGRQLRAVLERLDRLTVDQASSPACYSVRMARGHLNAARVLVGAAVGAMPWEELQRGAT